LPRPFLIGADLEALIECDLVHFCCRQLLTTRGHAWNINIRSPCWITNPGPRVPGDFCGGRSQSTRVALMSACSELFPVMSRT
jgi:hypothetical protein